VKKKYLSKGRRKRHTNRLKNRGEREKNRCRDMWMAWHMYL